mmetsp:Transcript_26900/g.82758  ORF Transcript_26900/g.82758 Transcript_26900/m.82758 type:complete len:301 (+) Transcript_26900:959-1861(+)
MFPAKLPPNSEIGWQHFSTAARGRVDRLGVCAPLAPALRQYVGNGTRILGERPADTKRVRLDAQLAGALAASSSNETCLKTIGYWQAYGLYAGLSGFLRTNIERQPLVLVDDPGPDDVVVHVRKCRWDPDRKHPDYFEKDRLYSWDNYFRHIFEHLDLRNGTVKIISVCKLESDVVAELRANVNATIAHPELTNVTANPHHMLRREAAILTDFTYMSRARRLVVTESTLAWWAAFLGDADEVHAPGSGRTPVPAAEAHYIFHDIHSRHYWGRYNTARRSIVYPNGATAEEVFSRGPASKG